MAFFQSPVNIDVSQQPQVMYDPSMLMQGQQPMPPQPPSVSQQPQQPSTGQVHHQAISQPQVSGAPAIPIAANGAAVQSALPQALMLQQHPPVQMQPQSAVTQPPTSTSSTPTSIASGSAFANIEPQRSSLWMGELEPYMDEAFIKNSWLQLGEKVQVKMIRDRYTGGNANYCFVDVGSYENAGRVLALYNGKPIPGCDKAFRLNWASGGGISAGTITPTGMSSMRTTSSAGSNDLDHGPEFSIFIGDLAPEVTEQMLMTLFQSYYVSVKSAKVVTDNVTGAPKGYGFVRFFDESEQYRALVEMQGMYCGSRPMRISMATPKNRPGGPLGPVSNGAAPVGTPLPNGQMYGIAAGAYAQPAGIAPMMAAAHPGAMEYNQFTDPNNTTVFVGGLTGYTTEDDLRSAFSNIGEVTYVKIPPGKNCGFVQFLHRACAEQAIAQMNGCIIGTSRVRLSWGRPQHVPPSATTPFSRMTPAFGAAPLAMAGMQAMPGLPSYPGFYPAPMLPGVVPSMFQTHRQVIGPPHPTHPHQQQLSMGQQPSQMQQLLVARDPRELQQMNQMTMQYMSEREENSMMGLEFANPNGVTA